MIADGRIDLVRIGELKPLAIELADVLERTVEEVGRVDVGWLVSPVASQIDDLQTELDDSVPAARNAAEALDAAPTLLGADGPRTYLVLAGNPAESRELGGFVGGFGLLTADAGELSFDTVAYPDVQLALEELEPQLPSGVPAPYAAARPQVFAQNWTDWPDFPEVARGSPPRCGRTSRSGCARRHAVHRSGHARRPARVHRPPSAARHRRHADRGERHRRSSSEASTS